MRLALLFAAVLLHVACHAPAQPAPAKSEPPAKVSGAAVKEGDLASVTLTPEAESRLGIRIASIGAASGKGLRRFAADVVLPPGASLTVAAPVSGALRPTPEPPAPGTFIAKGQVLFELSPLLPLPRDLSVTAGADVEQARTRVETAKLRKTRAEKMLRDEVGTVRAVEDANNELDLAVSALAAAQARAEQIRRAPLEGDVTVAVRSPRDGMLRQVLAAPGQAVNGGAPLFEVADLRTLWLRVPVYSGEAALLAPDAAVRVESLSGAPLGLARPVPAPPTGDPLAATVDFYYEAPQSAHVLKPGERVSVILPGRASGNWKTAPWSAVVYDIHGGAWIYEKAGERRYVRRRVQVDHSANGIAYLASGPPAGVPVVAEGVAELWGVEFGAGK